MVLHPPLWIDSSSKEKLSPLALSYILTYLSALRRLPLTHNVTSALLSVLFLRPLEGESAADLGHRLDSPGDFPYDLKAVCEYVDAVYASEFPAEFGLSPPKESQCRDIIRQGFIYSCQGLATLVQLSKLGSFPLAFSSLNGPVQSMPEALVVADGIADLSDKQRARVLAVGTELRRRITKDSELKSAKERLKKELRGTPRKDWLKFVIDPHSLRCQERVSLNLKAIWEGLSPLEE